jgi:metal-responsive CopG/Arc/MetJ family transcriptional regulator
VAIRRHITLDDALVRDLDRIVDTRERSAALKAMLDLSSDSWHDWDTDHAV